MAKQIVTNGIHRPWRITPLQTILTIVGFFLAHPVFSTDLIDMIAGLHGQGNIPNEDQVKALLKDLAHELGRQNRRMTTGEALALADAVEGIPCKSGGCLRALVDGKRYWSGGIKIYEHEIQVSSVKKGTSINQVLDAQYTKRAGKGGESWHSFPINEKTAKVITDIYPGCRQPVTPQSFLANKAVVSDPQPCLKSGNVVAQQSAGRSGVKDFAGGKLAGTNTFFRKNAASLVGGSLKVGVAVLDYHETSGLREEGGDTFFTPSEQFWASLVPGLNFQPLERAVAKAQITKKIEDRQKLEDALPDLRLGPPTRPGGAADSVNDCDPMDRAFLQQAIWGWLPPE